MKGNRNCSCRGLDFAMDRKKIPQNPPLSYFIRISIPLPKVRIKVPKLLVKTMQKRFYYGCNTDNADGDNEHKQHWTNKMRKKPGKLLTTKIRSVFVNAFGSMRIKSADRNASSDGENKMKREPKSSRGNGETNICALRRVDVGVANGTFRVVGEHGISSGNLNQVQSKLMITDGQKSRTGRSLGKLLSWESDEEEYSKQEERGGEELCKKRILMGGKCKPLSLSGTLQYDENGILAAEIIP